MSHPPLPSVHALARFGMNSPDARQLLRFYEQAFGARAIPERQNEDRRTRRASVQSGAQSTAFRLGDATIELLQFDDPGRPCPRKLSPYDSRFQHLGIVVTDMQRAMGRLAQTVGWTAISTGGPQRLPESAGGVTAFKFRDPDGHPLELLQFSAGNMPVHWRTTADTGVLGIDHSALSVTNAIRSTHFYESLGFALSNRTLNQGIEQERLDGVPAPVVDVIAMAALAPTPHIELLHYHTRARPTHEPPASNDTNATRLILVAPLAPNGKTDRLIQDPDGHFLQLRYCAEP